MRFDRCRGLESRQFRHHARAADNPPPPQYMSCNDVCGADRHNPDVAAENILPALLLAGRLGLHKKPPFPISVGKETYQTESERSIQMGKTDNARSRSRRRRPSVRCADQTESGLNRLSMVRVSMKLPIWPRQSAA